MQAKQRQHNETIMSLESCRESLHNTAESGEDTSRTHDVEVGGCMCGGYGKEEAASPKAVADLTDPVRPLISRRAETSPHAAELAVRSR